MSGETNPAAAFQQAVYALNAINASRYLGAAGGVLLIYDMFLTQMDEIRLVWPTRFGVVKILYFFNRWIPPLFQILALYHLAGFHSDLTDEWCKSWIITFSAVEIVGLGVVNYLLLLRVLALYGQSRLLLIGLHAFFIATEIAVIVIGSFNVPRILRGLSYNPFLKVCVASDITSSMGATFLAPIVFETTIFVLTVYKGWEYAWMMEGSTRSTIFYVLYRDGILYYIALMVVRIFNALVWMVLPHEYFYLGVTFIWAFVAAVFTRFFHNLREAAAAPPQGLITTHQTQFAFDGVPKDAPPIPQIQIREHVEQHYDETRVHEYDQSLHTVTPNAQSRRHSFSSHSHTMHDEHYEMVHPATSAAGEQGMA